MHSVKAVKMFKGFRDAIKTIIIIKKYINNNSKKCEILSHTRLPEPNNTELKPILHAVNFRFLRGFTW